MPGEETDTSEIPEKKPNIEDLKSTSMPTKSSMEILSELFESFDAEPPVIVKKEKTDSPHKKKGKKKHKHKDKKHKKEKKRIRSASSDDTKLDLAQILIKQEKEIKIEGTDLRFSLENLKKERDEVGSEDKKEKSDKKSSKYEDGEIPPERKHKKRKQQDEDKETKKKKLDTSKGKEKTHSKIVEKDSKKKQELKENDLRNKLKSHHRSRSRSNERHRSSHRSRERSRSREKYKRDSDRHRKNDKVNPFYRDDDHFWGDRYKYRDREQERRHHRSRSNDSSRIDKKKLLEIARRNAIQMMKSGNLPGALTLGPQAQEKVIAAIKAGGKTIEELTEFCKTLSKKEELGELSSNPESDSDNDVAFHHPFQIKDRPTTITMNIKNSVPLPTKTAQERTSELRLQFPVSSGLVHRKTENEWVPVAPKKTEPTPAPPAKVVVPIETVTKDTVSAEKEPETNTSEAAQESADINAIVSQRLSAMRKLQENPNDVQALTEIYRSNEEMQSWAKSKQQPGQFTGSTGAQILSQSELSSGYQAWAKKDQLTSAAPLSGGMGMHLLQKMGWKPGEGLGKEKTGALEPLLLDVKLDKKGLVANEEQNKKRVKTKSVANSIVAMQNKHPVSLLGEYASKRKLGAPQYIVCFECGPDHRKNFLFKVILNGIEYQPNVASPNKKEAKANAALVCLQHLGLSPGPAIASVQKVTTHV